MAPTSSPSIISLSSFAATEDDISDCDIVSMTKTGSRPDTPVQSTYSFKEANISSSLQEGTFRCRIQWLGGSSKFLTLADPGRADSHLVVTEVQGGRPPASFEWSVVLKSDIAEGTIQSCQNNAFISGTHLSSVPIPQSFQKIPAPMDAAQSQDWNDVQEQWICAVSLFAIGRLSVSSDSAKVSLASKSEPLNKHNLWRFQVLRDQRDAPIITPTPETLGPPYAGLSTSNPQGIRCQIIAHIGNSQISYLDTNVRDNTVCLIDKNRGSASEWILVPSPPLNTTYSIRLPKKSKYLAANPTPNAPLRLDDVPTVWRLEDLHKACSCSYSSPNGKRSKFCVIYPLNRSHLLLKTKSMSTALVTRSKPNNDSLKGRWTWHINFLEEPGVTNPALNEEAKSTNRAAAMRLPHPTVLPLPEPEIIFTPTLSKNDHFSASVTSIPTPQDGANCSDLSSQLPRAAPIRAVQEPTQAVEDTPAAPLAPTTDTSLSSKLDRASSAPNSSRVNHAGAHDESQGAAQVCIVRVQHILTGHYLTIQDSVAELSETPAEWSLERAGPGYTLQPGTSSHQLYLSPISNPVETTLSLSPFPATWNLSSPYCRQNTTTEDLEWICKICWPFNGRYVSADLAPNRIRVLGTTNKPRSLVWLSPVASEIIDQPAGLHAYWRVSFLERPFGVERD